MFIGVAALLQKMAVFGCGSFGADDIRRFSASAKFPLLFLL
jgi:hypothetical protein